MKKEELDKILVDPTVNRKGRRSAIAELRKTPGREKRQRVRDMLDDNRDARAAKVARKVEATRVKKALIEKAKRPSKITLMKRKIAEMRRVAKEKRAKRYAERMAKKA